MKRLRLTCLLALLLLAGCPVERPQGVFEAQDTGVDKDTEQDVIMGDATAAAGANSLQGQWGMIFQASTCVHALSAVIENLAWARFTFNMKVTGVDRVNNRVWVKVTGRLCSYELTPIVLDLAAVVPQKLIDSLPPVEVTCAVTYPEGTDLSGELPDPTGAAMSCDPLVQLWGLQLDDPINDPIPVTADDTAVFDQDNDGNPGMTLILGEMALCEMYIVQRSIYLFSGVFESPSLFRGDLQSQLTQNILAGTETLCESENETTANSNRNRLHLVRLDGFGEAIDVDSNSDGQVVCAEVVKELEQTQSFYGLEKDSPDKENCKQP